jgi:hypothetical protein
MAQRIAPSGQRRTLCFDCSLRETGGMWHPRDKYWDGQAWIAMAQGR